MNLKSCKKNKEGKYCIDGKIYDSVTGSRDNVYYEKSYKTSGGLIKEDLILNQNGLIVSKLKSVSETIYKRFEKCGVNKSVSDLLSWIALKHWIYCLMASMDVRIIKECILFYRKREKKRV